MAFGLSVGPERHEGVDCRSLDAAYMELQCLCYAKRQLSSTLRKLVRLDEGEEFASAGKVLLSQNGPTTADPSTFTPAAGFTADRA